MDNYFNNKENNAGRYSSGLPANDRQRAVPFDDQNYTPIKGIVYFTVFAALSFSILAFALVSQLRVGDQNFNSESAIAQPVSQAITKQATPATELTQIIEIETEAQDVGAPVSLLAQAVETAIELDQPLELISSAMERCRRLTAIADFPSLYESISDFDSTVYVEKPPVRQTDLAALEPESKQVAESLTDDQNLDELAVPVEGVVQVEAENVQQVERIQPELTVVTDSELDAQQAREPASNHKSLEHSDADSGQGSKPLQSVKTQLVQVAAVGVVQQSHIEPVSDTESIARIDEQSVEQPRPAVPVLEPLANELTALTDFDAENQSLPKSISDIESVVYVEETPVQQTELAVLEPESNQFAESMTDGQSLDELAVPTELVMQVVAEHEQQIERIQSELTDVIGSGKETQHLRALISESEEREFIEIEPNQISKELPPVATQSVQVAAVGVVQQSHVKPVSDTDTVARIDEVSVEHSGPAVSVPETFLTELIAFTDFDAENQSLPESISDIESTVYVEESSVQKAESAALELESLETELAQVAESLTDNQSLDELAAPAELVMQVVAEQERRIEQIQSELTAVIGSGNEAQHLDVLVSEREGPEFIEIEQDQISRELQPVATQLVQVAALGITQQSHIEPISNTESVARIGEESADQSQQAVPDLKSIVTELGALSDIYEENQILPESVSDIKLATYVGELPGQEPALLETEGKQVAESLIDDQILDEVVAPVELVVKIEAENERQVERNQPELTVDTDSEMDSKDPGVLAGSLEAPENFGAELAQSSSELAEAAKLETNDEGLGGPITDYEQALQLDKQPNQHTQPDVTVLEPVSGEEKLVPTGVAEPVILLSTDLESLANAPVVLTESNVRPGDTLSAIFKRNNLSYKIAQRLISAPGSKPISVLYPRDQMKFVWSNNKLLGIELRRKNKLSLMATYDGSQFTVINIREAKHAGTIVKLLKQEIESVEREDLIDYETQYAKLKNTNLKWSTTTVKKGDALSKIFRRAGLSAVEAIAVAGYPGNEWLATGLKPGQVMNIAKSEEGKFAILEVPEKGTAKVRLVFPVEEGYFVGFKKIKAEVQEHYACAEVESSLYSAGYAISIPREVLDEFVSLFESRFDFSRQLQRGDQFCIIYDREYIKGKPLKEINIKAGSLIQEDAELRAFQHVDDDDRVTYYDDEGLNMQGHFLRSPIKSARVVSKYSKKRYHPVLKTNRPHLGVDYGARTGTPIRSTATGQVIKRGWSGGYGRMIVIQHGSKYRTLYAHMSRYADGTSVGSYIKQGQVIGYVGSSGLSTGPHLHYEFHVNGRHRDPLQYDMPKGQPIPEQYKFAFQAVVDEFSKRLASIDTPQVEYVPPTHQTASSQ